MCPECDDLAVFCYECDTGDQEGTDPLCPACYKKKDEAEFGQPAPKKTRVAIAE